MPECNKCKYLKKKRNTLGTYYECSLYGRLVSYNKPSIERCSLIELNKAKIALRLKKFTT